MMTPIGYDPDPFRPDPFDAPESERVTASIEALTRLVAAVRSGQLSEDAFYARRRSGMSDLRPETGRHWLWRMHHRPSEVWKCVGRPNWSVAAYLSWRRQFLATPPERRLDRNGNPRQETLPKRAAGLDGLRHEHVVPMNLMLRHLLDGSITPSEATSLNQDAIITIAEDRLLDKSGHSDIRSPWLRYEGTCIRFIPNPAWSADHADTLARHGLIASEQDVSDMSRVAPLFTADCGPPAARRQNSGKAAEKLPDSDADALCGQLGRVEQTVRTMFFALDLAIEIAAPNVERTALRRNGSWLGRSYRQAGRTMLEVHPKTAWIKIRLPTMKGPIPATLRRPGEIRSDWLTVTPDSLTEAVELIAKTL